MPELAKDLIEVFTKENLQVGKIVSLLGGSDIKFSNQDCYNHLRS